MTPQLLEIKKTFQDAIRPSPILTVSECADETRVLPPTAAEPGKWRTRRTPYLREPMDCLSTYSPYQEIVLMFGTQLGKSEVGFNWINYIVGNSPGVMLIVNPTDKQMKTNVHLRVDRMIEANPQLKKLIADKKSKSAVNNMFEKEFPGGMMIFGGANSGNTFRSTPACYVNLDEIDKFPLDVEGEGDPIDLVRKRMATFGSRRKMLLTSTPTIEGESRIEEAFLETDQRRYFVPCKSCQFMDFFRFRDWRYDGEMLEKNILWPENEPFQAGYVCQSCGQKHQEADKGRLLMNGEWRPMSESTDAKKVGFHLSGLYSPFETMGEIAAEFIEVQDNPKRLKVWINTRLAETWKQKGSVPEWKRLYARREDYKIGTIPNGGLLVTAGIDVQQDRIEMSVWAWGRGLESWLIDHIVLNFNTDKFELWKKKFFPLIQKKYTHESGAVLPIRKFCIDTGYNTNLVYRVIRKLAHNDLIAIKGNDNLDHMFANPNKVDVTENGKRIARGVLLWKLGVSVIKNEIYSFLNIDQPLDDEIEENGYPNGYVHFPMMNDEYFKQICAEKYVETSYKGYKKFEWQQIRARNEALDCFVYARGAAAICQIDRFTDEDWKAFESFIMNDGTIPNKPKRILNRKMRK